MQLRPQDLDAHLVKRLEPLYVIHGDEPLSSIEAADAIRAAAKQRGYDERALFIVEQHFRWDAFVAANANRGLFGTRKLVDIRIASGKPGADGAVALERHARHLDPDSVTLVSLPRVDRATQSSAWFTALTDVGVMIATPPIERAALAPWISRRLARNAQRASPGTLAFLAERCEGNLLAAAQEIAKLALLLPEGDLAHDDVERAVADVARYDMQQLSEAWLSGDAARTLRIAGVLNSEGQPITLAVWQMSEDLHALGTVHHAITLGQSTQSAVRNARVWGRRQAALELAARRVASASVPPMLHALATLDAVAKGIGRGDPWDMLVDLALELCGRPVIAR